MTTHPMAKPSPSARSNGPEGPNVSARVVPGSDSSSIDSPFTPISAVPMAEAYGKLRAMSRTPQVPRAFGAGGGTDVPTARPAVWISRSFSGTLRFQSVAVPCLG